MSSATKDAKLNDCDCCEGLSASTPKRIHNRAGLPTITYRVGDYHSFKASMLAGLSSSDLPALQGLRSRDQNDFSIALIDAWASVSDVLCFYQEYFANESMLRSAKERLSILEHARLIGYQLNPGVAASSFLAFTMDEPLTATDNPVLVTTIAAGSQIQSTPGPDETAQLFETTEDIQARVDWNAMRPRTTQPQLITSLMQSILLAGITTFVKPGDELLIVNGSVRHVVKVASISINDELQATKIELSGEVFSPSTFTEPVLAAGSFSDFDNDQIINLTVIDTFINHSWDVDDIVAIADTKHWDLYTLMQQINARSELNNPVTTNNSSVHGFHKRANLFGYNAQKRVTYTNDTPDDISLWDEWVRASDENQYSLYLDSAYEELVKDGYLILKSPDLKDKVWYSSHSHYHYPTIPSDTHIYQVDDANVLARSAYGISSKSSKVTFSESIPGWDYSENMLTLIRQADVLVQSEDLELVQVPIQQTVVGDRLLLDHADLYLRAQQYVSITGEAVDQNGVQYGEVSQIKEVRLENGFTQLIFTTELNHEYVRNTVTINANVALASHGESVSEILGSGEAGVAGQSFSLKQMPLTYTSADVPSGAISSLAVRVNDVLWHEVDTLLERAGDEKIYTTKLDDSGITQLYFGDGIEGARLPSGNNNIIAYFRKGIGLGGLVKSKQLNLLLTRPLGVKDVVNPLESSGADDPEVIEEARTNAPLGLLTLGRAVSLSDYEDFSRAFAGVSKARAVAVSKKGVPSVVITVAGPNGALLDPVGETYQNLLAALTGAGDPYTHFSILSYRPAYFKFDAGLYVHADYQSDLVLEAARQVMRESFSFDVRSFNQPVHQSEVIQALQQVDGVIAVDLNYLYRSDASAVSPPPRSIMPNMTASGEEFPAAELITLDPAPLDQLWAKT